MLTEAKDTEVFVFYIYVIHQLLTPFPLEEYLGLVWGVGSGGRLAVDNLRVGRE